MTYRKLLTLLQQSRSSIVVRFKEAGGDWPPTGMVARLDAIWTAGKGKMARIGSLRFSFSEFAWHNVNFDTYDPAFASQPWLLNHLDAAGMLTVDMTEKELQSNPTLLDSDILWFDVLGPDEISPSSEQERIEAKKRNIKKVDEIRIQMVKRIWAELDVNDPNCTRYRSLVSKMDELIQNCIDRII